MSRGFIAGAGLGLVLGLASAALALDPVVARVDTNGQLLGYVVQKDGKDICRDPMVWNQFRGPTSYIVCD